MPSMLRGVQEFLELLASYGFVKKSRRTGFRFLHVRDVVVAKDRDFGLIFGGSGERRPVSASVEADQCRDHSAVAQARNDKVRDAFCRSLSAKPATTFHPQAPDFHQLSSNSGKHTPDSSVP